MKLTRKPPILPVSRRLFLGGIAAAVQAAVANPMDNARSKVNKLARGPLKPGAEMMRHWNAVAVDAVGLDHTPPAAGENRVAGEQLGPGRSSWAMAIVHA